MDLLQLKYFQVVANLQHITRASEKLHIAQPSLSMTIKKLEDDLNVALFRRSGRNIELTDEGAIFLKHVNTIFSELDIAQIEIKKNLENKHNTITMATSSINFLLDLLKDFLIKYPDIKFSQSLDSNQQIKTNLLEKKIDCCITAPLLKHDNIECIELATDEILLCVPNSHKLSSFKSISLKDITDENFILLSEKYSFRKLIDEICEVNNISLNISFEGDYLLARDLIHLGKGVLLAPRSIIKKFDSSNLSFIKLTEADCTRKIGFSTLKNNDSIAVETFKNFTINYFKENY